MKKQKKIGRICLCISVLLWMPLAVFASGPDIIASEDDLMFSRESAQLVSQTVSASAPPEVSAQCAFVMEIGGTVLYEKNADTRMSPASTTKIMTALTVMKACDTLDSPVKIPAEAVGVEGSSIYLYENEELTLRQLLYAMLMESANDAATAIACFSAGDVSAFAEQMNETAQALSLTDTHFMNPHGLYHEEHYTTARELAKITCEALQLEDFRKMVSTYKMEIPLKGNEGVRLLVNHNRLLKSLNGCIGVKTGYTKKSGRCLVSAVERDGCTLICVTLNAPDDWNDHTALTAWGFDQVEHVVLSEVGEQYTVLPVVGGKTDAADGSAMAAVRNEEALSATLLKKGQNIRKTIILPHFLYAPVQAGDIVGHVIYYNNDVEIGRLTLYACESVDVYQKPTLWERIQTIFRKK